ncbi:ATPase RavA [Frankliniella fusca]|uniref:ATPase RavA n=1 Tax=Frankliniella fusca TaxID=407009 RepID=A0AAE1LCA6_9NEOP|nr:ATPase RavA [Frankliniella fusca]
MPLRPLFCELGIHQDSFLYHVNDGFYYTWNGGNDSSIWFRCSIRSCNGTAILRADDGFYRRQPHNHAAQPLRHNMQAIRRTIINRASAVRYVSFADIVEEERLHKVPDRNIRAQLTYRRLRSAMQRARSDIYPNIPASLLQLTITLENPQWAHLTRTLDNSESVYCCSVTADDGSHSVIFTSRRCLEILKACEIIFLDGTFKITPAIDGCYQVFTIVTVESHTVLPLVWCLMDSKSESAYISVLLQIRARIIGWTFRIAISDYEDAIINAVEAVFAVEVQGYFHYVQALGSWSGSNITLEVLNTFPELLDAIRRCCALPLLPQNLLQSGMNHILPFLMYVQWDWLGHVNRGRTLSVSGSDH